MIIFGQRPDVAKGLLTCCDIGRAGQSEVPYLTLYWASFFPAHEARLCLDSPEVTFHTAWFGRFESQCSCCDPINTKVLVSELLYLCGSSAMFQVCAPNTAMRLILHSIFFFIIACVQILSWEGFLEASAPWGLRIDSAA